MVMLDRKQVISTLADIPVEKLVYSNFLGYIAYRFPKYHFAPPHRLIAHHFWRTPSDEGERRRLRATRTTHTEFVSQESAGMGLQPDGMRS